MCKNRYNNEVREIRSIQDEKYGRNNRQIKILCNLRKELK